MKKSPPLGEKSLTFPKKPGLPKKEEGVTGGVGNHKSKGISDPSAEIKKGAVIKLRRGPKELYRPGSRKLNFIYLRVAGV